MKKLNFTAEERQILRRRLEKVNIWREEEKEGMESCIVTKKKVHHISTFLSSMNFEGTE